MAWQGYPRNRSIVNFHSTRIYQFSPITIRINSHPWTKRAKRWLSSRRRSNCFGAESCTCRHFSLSGIVPGRYDTAVSNGQPSIAMSKSSSGWVRHFTCGKCAKVLSISFSKLIGKCTWSPKMTSRSPRPQDPAGLSGFVSHSRTYQMVSIQFELLQLLSRELEALRLLRRTWYGRLRRESKGRKSYRRAIIDA